MDAKSLMIGDWVSWNGNNLKVKGTSEDDTYFGLDAICDIVPNDEVEPIKVTKEIIEANGFKYNCACYAYRTSVCNPRLELQWYQYEKRLKVLYFDKECKSYDTMRFTDGLNYVHQLQHYLRIINETDLADNFKIE